MNNKGWVLLHRRFWDDPDFPDEPFTELQAWAWLFSRACYEDTVVRFRNQAIPLKRGQLATSIRILAKKFKWGRIKQDSYLKKLEKFGKILRQPKDRDYTILTICNYEGYQNLKDNDNDSDKTATKTGDKTATRQQQDNDRDSQPYNASSVAEMNKTGADRKQRQHLRHSPDSNKDRNKEYKEDKEKNNTIPFNLIIGDLNKKSGKNFNNKTEGHRKFIRARWNDGAKLEDFYHINTVKCHEWLKTDKEKYIRPSTLYSLEHFDSYLNQEPIKKEPPKKYDPLAPKLTRTIEEIEA